MTKKEAARMLRELARVMRMSMDGDEGIEAWADHLDWIAKGLDPRG